jgi:hypothetical protein
MSPLTNLALSTIEDISAAPGLRSVACSTLLHALEQAVEVPHGTHMAVWRYLLVTDGSAVALHRHPLIDADVAAGAVRILRDPDSGENAYDLAVAVLKDQNVRVVTDEDLVTIANRMTDEGHVRRLAWLIERVHEERGLTPEFLVLLRERLSGSADPSVRAAAVEIAGLAARLDEGFVTRMINDSAPLVRTAVADLLEKVEASDRPLALVIVRRQLNTELHKTVLSGLFHCMGSLVRAGGRRVRQWEPPTGGAEN